MTDLRYITAGESHGHSLVTIVEGVPSGLTIDVDLINAELSRRQGGYGRGGRMRIERDEIEITAGLRRQVSIGSPIALSLVNRDHRIDDAPAVYRPRPGHADLVGSLKWLRADCRETLERASARETAARTAAGSMMRSLLLEFGIDVVGYVVSIGGVDAPMTDSALSSFGDIRSERDANEAYCCDQESAGRMIDAIRQAKKDKDTLGGIVEVQVGGLPPGLGSCMRWQDKLDGRLMQAVASVQAIKAVEIGLGFGVASLPGSKVHDEIEYDADQQDTPSLGYVRRSNHAGGIEGGMSNGQVIVLRAAMKPISTLLRGLDSVNLQSLAPERSDYERSDICAVPAASVVVENVVAFELARAFLEKFAGDTMAEVRHSYESYLAMARDLR
ncbi:MAG: chorismate synthase [Planctomycetota bacterium]|jgi:chorismate synthase